MNYDKQKDESNHGRFARLQNDYEAYVVQQKLDNKFVLHYVNWLASKKADERVSKSS